MTVIKNKDPVQSGFMVIFLIDSILILILFNLEGLISLGIEKFRDITFEFNVPLWVYGREFEKFNIKEGAVVETSEQVHTHEGHFTLNQLESAYSSYAHEIFLPKKDFILGGDSENNIGKISFLRFIDIVMQDLKVFDLVSVSWQQKLGQLLSSHSLIPCILNAYT